MTKRKNCRFMGPVTPSESFPNQARIQDEIAFNALLADVVPPAVESVSDIFFELAQQAYVWRFSSNPTTVSSLWPVTLSQAVAELALPNNIHFIQKVLDYRHIYEPLTEDFYSMTADEQVLYLLFLAEIAKSDEEST